MCEAIKCFADVDDGEGQGISPGLPSFASSPIRDCVVGCFVGDDGCVQEAAKTLAKPIAGLNRAAAKQAYSVATSGFTLNNSQQSAVALALSRKVTTIVGPPGTGKTVTGCAVAHGFVELCGNHEKVLCCAYSNVGADNVARGLKQR